MNNSFGYLERDSLFHFLQLNRQVYISIMNIFKVLKIAVVLLIQIVIVVVFHLNTKCEIQQLTERIKAEAELNKQQLEQLELTFERLDQEIDQLNEQFEKIHIEVFEVTAYSPFDDRNGINSDGNPSITASGEPSQVGVSVAAHKDDFAFGTPIYIKGLGRRVVHDRGGAIKQGQIDVMVQTFHEAIQFGRQKLPVLYIKEDN